MRVVATGHSFTPLIETDGLVLDLKAINGIRSVDLDKKRVVLGSGTQIKDIGEPLWEKGLGLRNQGDIDAQRIAGAISTGTHGSGTQFGSFSASMTGCRLVTASGDVLEVNESTPELLAAAQVSVGMLGVMTDVEMQVRDRYRLRESIGHEPFEDVMSNFLERVKKHRNFAFFWFPSEESAALYNIELPPGEKATDTCHVKVFEEADPSEPDNFIYRQRVDRAYKIYIMEYSPNFHELEYFVPLNKAEAAIRELREETGLRVTPAELGEQIWQTAGKWFWGDGENHHTYVDYYFALQVSDFEVDASDWTEDERRDVLEFRWWNIADLIDAGENVGPHGLVDFVRHHFLN